MSILVLSTSHRTASLDLLSELTLDSSQRDKLLTEVYRSGFIDEALVLSTCNRTEVYASVSRFHAGLEEIAIALADVANVPLERLQAGAAVYYDERAVGHAFAVTSGLDSMVRGEQQILGQVRSALNESQGAGTVGTALNALFQQSLRVGKRVHHETSAGSAGRSLITAALDQLQGVSGRTVLVIGAGAMASLAARTAHAAGAELILVNRTREKADRLAESVSGKAIDLDLLPSAIKAAEVVISCTGGSDLQLRPPDFADTGVRYAVDLGLPSDIDPAVGLLPGVELINLATLSRGGFDAASDAELADAEELVAAEVGDFLAARRAAAVTPTVVALRAMAGEIVDSELARLEPRLPSLDAAERAEVAQAMRRVVDKLLHHPTVRVRQLCRDSAEVDYADALRELFALDAAAVRAVSGAERR